MTRITRSLMKGAAVLVVGAPCALYLAPAGWTQEGPTPVPFDVKPKSCPNPLELNKRDELPAGILGTSEFDATEIDPETVRLRLKDHPGEGVTPLTFTIEDVATPFVPFIGKNDSRDCNRIGRPDRLLDLSLKFDNQEVVQAVQAALMGAELKAGDVLVLEVTAELFDDGDDETPAERIIGEDVVVVRES